MARPVGPEPRAASALAPLGASIAALLVAALLAAPSAAAQPTPAPNDPGWGAGPSWLYPAGLSDSSDGLSPKLAVDSQGNAVVVWRQWNGQNYVIESASRAAGDDWRDPHQLSLEGADAADPYVAVGANGDVVATWSRYSRGHWIVQSAVRPVGKPWSLFKNLSHTLWGWDSREPRVAVAADGQAVVVWDATDAGNPVGVHGAVRRADGSWGPVEYVSPAREPVDRIQVAIAPSGQPTAIWSQQGEGRLVRAATRPLGEPHRWEPVQTLTEEYETATEPDITVDAEGRATAVYRVTTSPDGESSRVVRARSRQAGAPEWGASEDLSQLAAGPSGSPRACADAHDPLVTTGPADHTVAIWACLTQTAGNAFVQARARTPGESRWSGTADISGRPTQTDPDSLKPQVGVDAEGEAIAVWGECEYEECSIKAVTRPVDQPWSKPNDVAGYWPTGSPRLGVDASGNAAAAWASWDGGQVIVAGYDGSGPALRSLRIPESGAVQTELHFSVWPVDTWSLAMGVFWDFGDGDTARGREAIHTYRHAGDYRVTVLAADSLGIPSKQSSPIHIRPLGPADPEPRIWP